MSITAQHGASTKDESLQKRSVSKRNLAIVLALLCAVVLFGLGTIIREETRKVVFVIPPNTSQNIETGRPGVEFPAQIDLIVGLKDTIIIENQDDVIHSFGPFVVGPHSTLTKRFEVPITYEGACTFHQEQHMRLVVNPAPWNIFN